MIGLYIYTFFMCMSSECTGEYVCLRRALELSSIDNAIHSKFACAGLSVTGIYLVIDELINPHYFMLYPREIMLA